MNGLSWLIYGIGVMDGLRDIAIGAMVACSGVAIFGGIFAPMMLEIMNVDEPMKKVGRAARWVIGVAAVCAAVIVFAPSRQTLMLIAGSEIGQRVAQSESVTSIVEPGADLLREWIRSETKRLRGKSNSE